MRRPHPPLDTAQARRLRQLASAFAAFRRASPRRRFPPGLRAQVLAAVGAGLSAGAISRACGLSWTQVTRWRSASPRGAPTSPSSPAPAARVLSVVDADARDPVALDADVELRIGPWRVSLRHAID